MTHQREIILEELKRLRTHPTADELYEIVKKRLPRISLATVYRNLEQLSAAGIIQKLDFVGRQMRYDGDISKHSHIRCVECGSVADVRTNPIQGIDQAVVDACGYKVLDYHLDFLGLCPICLLKKHRDN